MLKVVMLKDLNLHGHEIGDRSSRYAAVRL
jgi:hypothetical protein